MSRKEKFGIKVNLVIIGTDIPINKQYVLSSDSSDIVIPSLSLEKKYLKNIDDSIIEYAQTLVFTNELELTPQLISLHNDTIENASNNELNVIYGFVVKKTENIDNSKCFWIEFDYVNPNKYSNLLFEVTQKLK
jgi:hypothetical protein